MQKKHSKVSVLLVIITIIGCIYGFLSFTGILDGIFLELDSDTTFGLIIFGIIGILNILVLILPIWAIYFYIKRSIKLYKTADKKQFYTWLIMAPIITIILIVLAIYYYKITHIVI